MTAQIRNLLHGAILLVLSLSLPVQARAALPPSDSFQIVTNTDGFEAVRLALTTSYGTQAVFTINLGARPQFTVQMNVGGILVFLSAATNRLNWASIPELTLSLVNTTTSQTPFLRWIAGGPPVVRGLHRLEYSNRPVCPSPRA